MKKIKLGDLCVPSAGQLKKDSDELIDYIDISSVDNETKKVTGYQTLLFEEAPSRARKTVKKGSILVSTVRPNLNAVAMLEEDTPNISVASTGFCVLDSKENVDNRFILNFCKSKTFINAMVAQATGASYPAVSDKIVRTALVPDYTYEEQCNISEVLDKVSNVIEKRKAELCSLDDLIKARFVEMFGDPVINSKNLPVVTLGELSELITKGASPCWQGFSYTDDSSQTLFITSENIREGYIDLSSPKYIEDGFNEKQRRSVIRKGDFLINIVGASIGRAAQFNLDCKANMNQAAALVRVKDNRIKNKYLLIYLNSDRAKRMYDSMKSDTGRANLSLQDISDLNILLPAVDKQIEFENFVAQVDKSKSAVKKALDETQLLFDSLMQEYFG